MSETFMEAGTTDSLGLDQVADVVSRACSRENYRGKRVLLIVPDSTRTAPVGALFQALHRQISGVTRALDVLVALGTHQPMSEEAICQRLEITEGERRQTYAGVRFFNHSWNDPAALTQVGVLSSEAVSELTGGLFAMDVPVEVNRMIFDYDQVIIAG
ncbi:MAG TPA: lactate racemase domain-containing protein, partial [Clostridia bacterium]|nr:lactate racemase domain-containing protein [Clostridia bacterium]